ncbi:MAG: hypothetical protein HYZ75_01400 [Elusimicrobia bacterium]|nr:hypothetical protein [Elusimicrobiota bacterium]
MQEEAPPPPPQEPGFRWWLALIPIVLLSLLMYWLVGGRPGQPETVARTDEDKAFNVDEVPPEDAPAEPYVSNAEREAAARMDGSAGGPGLSGFIPEKDKIFHKENTAAAKDDSREKEAAFIKRYDPLIRREQRRLNQITARYRKKEAVVRQVDMAFGALPRYMALRQQYYKDRNPYAFVRGAITLPEVRKTVFKYATSPEVWRVTVGMMVEGLRQKPPPEVYNETKRFMTEDKTVSGFVTDVSAHIMPRAGLLLPAAIRPGQDIGALKVLAKDLNVAGAGNTADLSAARKAVEDAQTGRPAP